jgi:hypothetical protein
MNRFFVIFVACVMVVVLAIFVIFEHGHFVFANGDELDQARFDKSDVGGSRDSFSLTKPAAALVKFGFQELSATATGLAISPAEENVEHRFTGVQKSRSGNERRWRHRTRGAEAFIQEARGIPSRTARRSEGRPRRFVVPSLPKTCIEIGTARQIGIPFRRRFLSTICLRVRRLI